MTDPIARDLIQRLAPVVSALAEEYSGYSELAQEVRAYLAQLGADEPAMPDGSEPASVAYEASDAELLELMPETMRDELSYAAKVCSDATGGQVKPGIFRTVLNTVALEYARAVLARWGSH